MTYRDLVIEELSDSEAALSAERDAYRTLMLQAIQELHLLTRERNGLRVKLWREQDQHRHLRAQLCAAPSSSESVFV